MRCLACNCQLNDHESTRKYASSGTFVDLCDRCFATVEDEIPTLDGAPPEGGGDNYIGDDYADDGYV